VNGKVFLVILVVVALAVVFVFFGSPDPAGEQMVSVTDFEELPPATAKPGDCPWWRGAAGDGNFGEQDVPLEWGAEEGVLWSTRVPGLGHASPCVHGDRVFIFTAEDDSLEISLLGYSRSTGKEIWRTPLHKGGFMNMHGKNSHASATPACDGERVFAVTIVDGMLITWAVDLDGKPLWANEVGDFESTHGYGSSPVLHKSFVIVAGDNEGIGFVAAIHRKTGETIWKTRRTSESNYGTPIVATIAGRTQLVIPGAGRVTSYNPDTGEELWRCDGPTKTCGNTVAWDEQHVFASGGYPDKQILCIRADGEGDVTDSHVVWSSRKGVAYVPSPLYHDGRLYVVSDKGIITCFNSATGDLDWRGRLRGGFSASPHLVGGHIFVVNELGTTFVLKAGGRLDIVAENKLDSSGMASTVACGDRLFIRGESTLYCVGDASTVPSVRASAR
jgi:outer membrane protein assembly factor BamB